MAIFRLIFPALLLLLLGQEQPERIAPALVPGRTTHAGFFVVNIMMERRKK
jgi:hypothetical protein